MARPKTEGAQRGKLVSSEDVKQKCIVCGVEYYAHKMTYSNGDVTITPPRCPMHQTQHLTSVRVSKVIDGLRLLKNIKGRLTADGRQNVLQAINSELVSLAKAYQATDEKKTKEKGLSFVLDDKLAHTIG